MPGTLWMVDLPGDGSNTNAPGAGAEPFEHWPEVLVEAALALPNAVYVGHSTGGMYILSTPALESRVAGLALVSTAPDARWRSRFAEMTARDPLPAVDAASAAYAAERTPERLRDVAVASAEWNFTAEGVRPGRELLARMPYNADAVDRSDQNFDDSYAARWWPAALPTLILGGADDRIVARDPWNDPRHGGDHVLRRAVEGAGHFPWIEHPEAVRGAFAELADRVVCTRG